MLIRGMKKPRLRLVNRSKFQERYWRHLCLQAAGITENRNIVQIFNADGTQLAATVLAVPDKRLHATGKTVMKSAERPGNSPEALKAWFHPGDQHVKEPI